MSGRNGQSQTGGKREQQTDDKGGQLELVNPTAAQSYGYPLTLWTYDETLRNKLNSALYAVASLPASSATDITSYPIAPGSKLTAPAKINFAYSDGEISAAKTYTFEPNGYVIRVQTEVR